MLSILALWDHLNWNGQKMQELRGTDPRSQFLLTIHLWETDTLATRSGLSLRNTDENYDYDTGQKICQ